jgi:superfamily II RNA helicase
MSSVLQKNWVNICLGPCPAFDLIEKPALHLKFKPYDFQKHGFCAIESGYDVLCTAHTGSGKTMLAKYAIAYHLRKGGKIIYLAPIKALSNEKFRELCDEFESEYTIELGRPITVGILTGDIKIRPNADILIATTEIIHNVAYKLKTTKSTQTSDDFVDLNKYTSVIIDEAHFINDAHRGKVYENTLVLLPSRIQLVMLSATLDKAENFAKWVGQIKQKTISLISTTHRIVPLTHNIFVDNKLYPIMDRNDVFSDVQYDLAATHNDKIQKNRHSEINLNLINEILVYLKTRDMLPVIMLSLSKKQCEKFASMVEGSFITHLERKEIEEQFNKYMLNFKKNYQTLNQYNALYKLFMNGIGFHHAGLAPILKEITEILFKKKLIKVIFATETLALGLNLPAKTVVFTGLQKHTEAGKRLLTKEEYTQIAGRAGRPGYDSVGTVILAFLYEFLDRNQLKSVLTGKVSHVVSKFKVDYDFLLKTLQSDATDMKSFLNLSLYEYEQQIQLSQSYLELDIIQKENIAFKEDIDKKINPDLLENFNQYLTLQNQNQSFNNLKLKPSAKQQKMQQKLNTIINTNKELFDLYNKYCTNLRIESEYKDQIKKSSLSSVIDSDPTSYFLTEILMNYGYIYSSDKNISELTDKDITMKGVMAACMNECNPLIVVEMISQNIFDTLTSTEIVGLLAIFISDAKSKEKMTLDSAQLIATPNLKTQLRRVEKIISDFRMSESENGLDSGDDFWEISYEFVDIAIRWASDESLNSIISSVEMELYEGSFIKHMLKINNIAEDLGALCKISNRSDLLPIFDEIPQLLIKEIVNVTSIYLGD